MIRRKMLLKMLSAPMTAAPFIVGVTALIATWALGLRADVGIMVGLAGIFGAAGVFFTKLMTGGEGYAKEAIEEVEEETKAEHEKALDTLDAKLCQDGDPRTEAALRDLRSLAKAFRELRENSALDLNALSASDIEAGVQKLFDQSVRSLERSFSLWQTARQLTTNIARQPLLKQRELIIQDVGNGIKQMGQVLVALQNIGSGEGAKSDLVKIGEELDQHLKVAKQVEERVRAFEDQLGSSVSDKQ